MDLRANGSDVLEEVLLDVNEKPRQLTLSLLQSITDNFSDKMRLGKGGSADVYKGVLGIGTMVAVKKLSALDMNDKLFNKEFECLMKARHKNIVRFLGYCHDTQGLATDLKGKAIIAEHRNRVLCFEYASQGSLDSHISDASGGLNWNVRYQIIKGICEGLHYLHENRFLHLDLKPANILLDDKMVPKLADFGLARRLDQNKSQVTATTPLGTRGYLAPEFWFINKSTIKLDIYSLGVTIMEILTGQNRAYYTVENVIKSWTDRMDTQDEDIPMQQVRTCAEIGIMCMDNNPDNRPTTQHIIKKLKELGDPESSEGGESTTSLAHVIRASDGSKLLRIHPLHLRFPVESDTAMISCPLQLKNYTDDHIAFRILTTKIEKKNFKGPLCGIVPPRSTYTVAVTMCSQLELPSTGKEFLTLESSVGVYREFQKAYHIDNVHGYGSRQLAERTKKNYSLLDSLFSTAKGNSFDLHRLKLTAAYMAPVQVRTESKSKITITPIGQDIKCIDVHPKEPWILTGNKSNLVQIRDYNTQETVKSFHIKQSGWRTQGDEVDDVKFVISTELFVAAATNVYIEVWRFTSSDKPIFSQYIIDLGGNYANDVRIAIQPTQPHLLAMGPLKMEMWDWEANKRLYVWDLKETGRLMIRAPFARFNPGDPTSFGLVLNNNEVKIENTVYGDRGITLISNREKFGPVCLEYFTQHDVLYLIIGCKDTTAKIWDCQTGNCVQTLKGHSAWVTSVCYCSDLQMLITGSNDGTVRLWSSTTFEVQGVIDYGLEGVQEIYYLKDSKSIVTKHGVRQLLENRIFLDDSTAWTICKTSMQI